MRLSGFIMGSIVGAAAAMYFSRSNQSKMAKMNWDQVVNKAGEVAKTVKTMWDVGTTISMGNATADSGNEHKTQLQ